VGDGGCTVSMLLSMKSAESLNPEILMRGLGYVKRLEWYGCGHICTETMGSTYRHGYIQGK
jgi:hypothetical protein